MNTSSCLLDPLIARRLPWLIAMAFFMQMLDTTIVNTALPTMAASLGENPLQMQSVVISYMLTLAMVMPISGWLADRFGAKNAFFAAILVFTSGSLLCGISSSLDMLVAARILQGLGGALLMPVGRLAVLKLYPRQALVQILSFIVIPALLGPLLGPVVGGVIVQYVTWHWIFLINVPLGMLGAILTLKWMPAMKAEGKIRFDWLGFVLFSSGIVFITLALEATDQFTLPVPAPYIMAAGLGLVAAYWLYAGRADHPLFSYHLFTTKSFSVGILGNLFARLCSGAMPFLSPMLLQLELGYSPFKAGLMMIPLALSAIVAKKFVTGLIKTIGYRSVLIVNSVLLGLATASFALISPETSMIQIIIQFWIFGTVNSIQFTAMSTLTIIDLPDLEASSGNSLFSVVMQVSMTLGVALAAIILNFFAASLPEATEGYSLPAFHYTYIILGLIAVLSSFIFVFTPSQAGSGQTR